MFCSFLNRSLKRVSKNLKNTFWRLEPEIHPLEGYSQVKASLDNKPLNTQIDNKNL